MDIAQSAGDPRVTEWALDAAAYATGMSGRPVGVSVNTVGPQGQWAWHSGADSLGELEADSTALWADPGFLEKMADAQGLFVPGHGGQGVYARVD